MYVGADHHGGAGHGHRTYARTAAGERVPESDGRLFAVLRLPAPRLGLPLQGRARGIPTERYVGYVRIRTYIHTCTPVSLTISTR